MMPSLLHPVSLVAEVSREETFSSDWLTSARALHCCRAALIRRWQVLGGRLRSKYGNGGRILYVVH